MRRIIVESPYAGNVEHNVAYARACLADALRKGESPFASHLLFTQPTVLDDLVPEQRKLGIRAGFAWAKSAHAIVFYTDLGWSKGMQEALVHHQELGRTVIMRKLGPPWSDNPYGDY